MVTLEDLLSVANALEGRELLTPSKQRPFKVFIEGGKLTAYPEISEKRGRVRITDPRRIQAILDVFNSIGSPHLRDYPDEPRLRSYILPLIHEAAKSKDLTR